MILIPGSMQRFDAGGDDGKIRVGVWDRFTSWGEKIKDDKVSVFNEETLGQMVDNWLARGDELAMCFNHQSAFVELNGQPAPALAWYNALAIVKDGTVIRYEALDASKVGQLEAEGRGDGLYGFRSEVTSLGQELLGGFKFISPMFHDEGKDEQGKAIGYVLYDVAATNTPFQAGCEITFGRGRKLERRNPPMSSLPCPVCGQKTFLVANTRGGWYLEPHKYPGMDKNCSGSRKSVDENGQVGGLGNYSAHANGFKPRSTMALTNAQAEQMIAWYGPNAVCKRCGEALMDHGDSLRCEDGGDFTPPPGKPPGYERHSKKATAFAPIKRHGFTRFNVRK